MNHAVRWSVGPLAPRISETETHEPYHPFDGPTPKLLSNGIPILVCNIGANYGHKKERNQCNLAPDNKSTRSISPAPDNALHCSSWKLPAVPKNSVARDTHGVRSRGRRSTMAKFRLIVATRSSGDCKVGKRLTGGLGGENVYSLKYGHRIAPYMGKTISSFTSMLPPFIFSLLIS